MVQGPGKMAAAEGTAGPGSMQVKILDCLHSMTREDLEGRVTLA